MGFNDDRSPYEDELRIGNNLGFAANEAYNLLRTNLFFSFPDTEQGGNVVGITSSIRGEGKSTTSINLAISLAESGKKTALVEGDMRLPNMSRRLNVDRTPGLSNLIVGRDSVFDIIKTSVDYDNLYILPAGNVPPNPSELLSSLRFKDIIAELKENFDYVIVDLPPVTVVSDALVVASLTDGVIVVVRHGMCTQSAVNETMRQLKVVEKKILGFVYTCADVESKKYYKKRKGGYYKSGYSYGYGYGYGYETSPRRGKKRSRAALDTDKNF